MSVITIKASVGEVLDKLSILSIKKDKVLDSVKLRYIEDEFNILNSDLGIFLENEDIYNIYRDLREVNESLWEIEDKIRIFEKKQKFDSAFVELARSVYKTNDLRFALKNKINELTDSELREQKDYC
jgi:hypothetical protein